MTGNYRIPKSDFEKALERVPIEGLGRINKIVRGRPTFWQCCMIEGLRHMNGSLGRKKNMDSFAVALRDVNKKCLALLKSPRYKVAELPKNIPTRGVYVFSKSGKVLYIGRTDNLRRRLQLHTRNNHNQATFAFLLARKRTGIKRASYQKAGSRSDLLRQRKFRAAFDAARHEIHAMDVQFIAERNPNKQALLEICAAIRTGSRFNNFNNH